MKLYKILIFAFFSLVLFGHNAQAEGLNPYIDYRYCGQPNRIDGNIVRDSKVTREFQKIHPCPATGLKTGACAGWSKDHIWPLARCGCDSVNNMQWLKNSIKSCAGTECKDRWELTVYQCESV